FSTLLKSVFLFSFIFISSLPLFFPHCSVALFFFFQAEDGIRDYKVTGVQTCALPISFIDRDIDMAFGNFLDETRRQGALPTAMRSEEHTSELQSPCNLVCRLLLEKKKTPAARPTTAIATNFHRRMRSNMVDCPVLMIG